MDKDFYTVKDAAKKLNLSISSVRALIRSGKLSFYRIGMRSIRISNVQLDEYLEKVVNRGGKPI